MTRILLLGLDPETVDFSGPALPPGMTGIKHEAVQTLEGQEMPHGLVA
jgi:hypothetical protein